MVDDKAVQLLPLMESNLQLGPAGNPHPSCFDEGNSTKMMIFEDLTRRSLDVGVFRHIIVFAFVSLFCVLAP